MKDGLKWTLWTVTALVATGTLLFALNAVGWVNLAFWGPKYEDTKRDIFENTQSFVHGKESHITRLRLEYESTDSKARRESLRRMILQEAATVDREKLSPGLQAFLSQLESPMNVERGTP